jgi:large subunit ribosomal protein L19
MAEKEKNTTSNNTAGQDQPQTERVIANFRVGDRVRVYFKIEEGKQTREAFFEGQVIAQKGSDPGKTLTVRKIAADRIPVERIFPLNSPKITKIDLVEKGKGFHRAKLYYLRQQIG